MDTRKQRVIVILGMHRGGTSAIARGLQAIGVPLGDNLLPPRADNPKGFWEDLECLALNEELLCHFHSAYDRLGSAWRFADRDPAVSALKVKAAQLIRSKMARHDGLWGFKDPRTCRLLPFWREVIESTGCMVSYAIALRNPLSVALSLQERNHIPLEKASLLWLQHMLPAILETSGSSRVVVDYDLLLEDPLRQLARMASILGLASPGADSPAIRGYVLDFLDSKLRHSNFAFTDVALDERLPNDLCATYDLVLRVARDEIDLEAPGLAEELNKTDCRLRGYAAAFEYANKLEENEAKLYRLIGSRDEQAHVLRQGLVDREREITTLRLSLSDFQLRVDSLRQDICEREGRIAAFREIADQRGEEAIHLHQSMVARDRQIADLKAAQSAAERLMASSHQELSAYRSEVELLRRASLEKEAEIGSLRHSLSEQEGTIGRLDHALSDREGDLDALNKVLADHDGQVAELRKSLGERDERADLLEYILSERDREIASFRSAISALRASLSWRVTAPLRYVYDLLGGLNEALRSFGSSLAARPTPRQVPDTTVRPPERTDSASSQIPQAALLDAGADYVEDSPPPDGFLPNIRLIAFYLPQFHPIPENDAWWGRGFTEWTNVVKAAAQFQGHYQPHLPGELGFYDLRLKEVQVRQVELAKRYGIGAFCFYFYWFGGTRLLDLPIRQYLDDPGLDLPFCLCWANENWTRRWDGLDDEVLIGQKHSPEDDVAFIEHVARYMADSRYLRVNGRPVLLVYRPSLLPDVRATVVRWREWAQLNGLGDLYLIYPQSFETAEPETYGFDAATEFPPNLSGPPVLTDQVTLSNSSFSGVVYDWRILVERSRHYSTPGFKLFRGVCPSWDSEPRRPGRGTVFLHATPDAYREWLTNAAADTQRRFLGDERLVFANAWNEWAEGAHLEPDRRYGYAWLQATRQALSVPTSAVAVRGKVVVVTHDAYPHGGQYIALSLARELAGPLHFNVEIVCLGDGPLIAEFAKCGKVHVLSGIDHRGQDARRLAAELFRRGFSHALVNTTVSGLFLETLKLAGFHCVALVHELQTVLLNYGLEEHARRVAIDADCIVFPAPEVRVAFAEFAPFNQEKAIVRPQGLLKRNSYVPSDMDTARRTLRKELGLHGDDRIVLAVGYADERKGIDFFLDIAAKIADQDPKTHLVWVGAGEKEGQRLLIERAKRFPNLVRHVHFTGHRTNTDLYYAGSDLFALTSREDPFPCVVLEAMHAGMPIVAFAGSGGSNALVDEGLGKNVPMGSTTDFAEAIISLLTDTGERDHKADFRRTLIAEHFSFAQYVFDLLDLAGIGLRRVSVVVPNFNYAHYLPDRIATIVNQTYPIYELIFLDDASRDNSVSSAAALLVKARVDYRIVANRENSGSVSAQWKRGVELARGDIVWIAEADDLSDPDFLSTVLEGFEDPKVVLSYCESKQIDLHGCVLAENYQDYVDDLGPQRWRKDFVNEGDDEISRYLAVKNTIPNVSAALMRREDLLRVLNQRIEDIRRFKVAGDWKTYLHLLSRARIAYSAQALNLHRRHYHGVTIGAPNELHFREIQEIQRWVADNYILDPSVTLTMQRYLNVLGEQFGVERAARAVTKQ